MRARQATIVALISALFTTIAGCTTAQAGVTVLITATAMATITPAPTRNVPSPTATAAQCLSLPGTLGRDSLKSTAPAQEFIFYLPPCYFERLSEEYPVVYLLHGQTYTDEQWVRIGAADAADTLIISGEAPPFIIVLPDDRGWNLDAGPGFGDRLLALIPHIDATFRTLDDREHRALGGLSRGGGWTARLGFTHVDLFGALGLHSPALFKEDGPYLRSWVQAIPEETWPRMWLDVGDRDSELGDAIAFTDFLAEIGLPHEFRRYAGDHTEGYWGQHVEEYLRWYAQGWSTEQP